MNSFIPALIAVLLAELGGRAIAYARMPRLSHGDRFLVALVAMAVAGGVVIAPTMTDRARALLLGLALVIAASGQVRNTSADMPTGWWAVLRFVMRGNVAFLAFAFAIWRSDPLGSAAGALLGLVGACVISAMIPAATLKPVRIGALAALAAGGIYMLLWALRLTA